MIDSSRKNVVIQELPLLWNQNNMNDLRLCCRDGSLSCNKLVVVAGSQLLCHLMMDAVEADLIILPDFHAEAARNLLEVLHGTAPKLSIGTECNTMLNLSRCLGFQLHKYLIEHSVDQHSSCTIDPANNPCNENVPEENIKMESKPSGIFENKFEASLKERDHLEIDQCPEDSLISNVSSGETISFDDDNRSHPLCQEQHISPTKTIDTLFKAIEMQNNSNKKLKVFSELGEQSPTTPKYLKDKDSECQEIKSSSQIPKHYHCHLCSHKSDDINQMELHLNSHGYQKLDDHDHIHCCGTQEVEQDLSFQQNPVEADGISLEVKVDSKLISVPEEELDSQTVDSRESLESNDLICDKCDNSFSSLCNLKEHKCDEPFCQKLIGNLHDIKGSIYMPWEKARSIVESYMNIESSGFFCILCEFQSDQREYMHSHLLKCHLKLYVFQCGKCYEEFKLESEYRAHLQSSHRMSASDIEDIFKTDEKQIKPFKRKVLDTEEKPKRPKICKIKETNKEVTLNYHHLKEDTFVGFETGMKIVKQYYYKVEGRMTQCKLCNFRSESQGVQYHIFAKHLVHLFLYRCDVCGKEFRYSKKTFRSHLALHTEGRQACAQCLQLGLNLDKKFTHDSLRAHEKRFHTRGEEHHCSEVGCGTVYETSAHLRRHQIDQHSVSKLTKFMCSICQHFFPTNFQLSSHMESCQAGRSRTLFRQQLADSLTWEGKGVYSCKMCGETFYPPRPTSSSLAKARKHVATIHKKIHIRQTKMSWTQGVDGLNLAKKAARRRKAMTESFEDHGE